MLYVVHEKGQAFCRNGVVCDATTKHKGHTAENERLDGVGVPGCRCAAVPIARARACEGWTTSQDEGSDLAVL